MQHLVSTAAGWGGNPGKNALYVGGAPEQNADGSVTIRFGGAEDAPSMPPITLASSKRFARTTTRSWPGP